MMNKYLVQDCDDALVKVFDQEIDAIRFIKSRSPKENYHLLVDRVMGL